MTEPSTHVIEYSKRFVWRYQTTVLNCAIGDYEMTGSREGNEKVASDFVICKPIFKRKKNQQILHSTFPCLSHEFEAFALDNIPQLSLIYALAIRRANLVYRLIRPETRVSSKVFASDQRLC